MRCIILTLLAGVALSAAAAPYRYDAPKGEVLRDEPENGALEMPKPAAAATIAKAESPAAANENREVSKIVTGEISQEDPQGQNSPGQGFQGFPGQNFQGFPGQGFQGQNFQGFPGQNYQNFPGQGFPGQGFPGQGFPGQGFPGQGFPGQNYPGYPGQGFPGQGFPGQGFPGQGFPGQGFPGQGFPGQGFPGQGFPGQGFPGQGFPGQGFPGQGFPGQGYPGHGFPGQPNVPFFSAATPSESELSELSGIGLDAANRKAQPAKSSLASDTIYGANGGYVYEKH